MSWVFYLISRDLCNTDPKYTFSILQAHERILTCTCWHITYIIALPFRDIHMFSLRWPPKGLTM
jgi:uncharacterized lipoprotein YddW (UPF0748 family)